MSERMNVYRPYYQLGPEKKEGTDYCWQDKTIYCWSDSNIGYEIAWWLTKDGWPINLSEHVANILRDRPFDPEWLKEPRLRAGVERIKIK